MCRDPTKENPAYVYSPPPPSAIHIFLCTVAPALTLTVYRQLCRLEPHLPVIETVVIPFFIG